MGSETFTVNKHITFEIFLSVNQFKQSNRLNITDSIISISPFVLSIDDPLTPSKSSYLTTEINGDSLIDGVKLSNIIDNFSIDKIEVYLHYNNLKKLSSLELYQVLKEK
ncbi:MAG: hypothetical protein ACUVWP_07620 [bacterium]